MSKEKSNKQKKCAVVMIYDGDLSNNEAVFDKAIVCKGEESAIEYLIKKGYAKEKNVSLSKSKKKKIRQQDLLYVNKSKNKVAGILKATFHK